MRVEGVGEVGALNVGLICTMKSVSLFVKKLIKTEGDAFGVITTDESGHVTYKEPGVLLERIIKIHMPRDSWFTTNYKFEPYIEMAVKYFSEYALYQVLPLLNLGRSVDDAVALMRHLNECVDKIRQEAKSVKFLSKLNSYQRSSNKNFKMLTEYVDALFECRSRLLVLRVDLTYQKQYSQTTQAEARRDRERLFENARSNKMFCEMVGFIWKLEHGSDKGFHYHVMFFFDGSKVRQDITLAKRIGQYWTDVVTKGRGLYFNCNAGKLAYKSCGIGMVDHTDAKLRQGLRNAVIYLTKTDLFMKLQTEGRGMGKGLCLSSKGPRGRPRVTPSAQECMT
jgi:hypothetical protein